jgi:hypothetical protein
MKQQSLLANTQDTPLILDAYGWGGSALFSHCNKYRYELRRTWTNGDGTALVVMLNPSTADGAKNDPTIERVCRTVRVAGVRELVVVNLFAYRTPYPAELVKAHRDGTDIIGAANDRTIAGLAINARLILAAWGSCSDAPLLARERAHTLCFGAGPLAGRELLALRLTNDGAPAHPLYLPKALTPTLYPRAQLERWVSGERTKR